MNPVPTTNISRTVQLLALALWSVGRPPLVAAQAPLSTTAIASRATPGTVTIYTFGANGEALGQGSGFLVRSDGVVVTNHHVMAGAHRATVKLSTGEEFDRVQALDADEDRDIAILKIPGFGLPVLTPAPGTPQVGDGVVVIGAPRGLEATVSEGIVSAVRLVEGQQWIQITAPISPGSSGGPVLDRRGRVIAIATLQFREGQSLNFAVPVRYGMGLVAENQAPRTLAESFGSLSGSGERTQGAATSEAVRSERVFPAPARDAKADWLPDTYLVDGWTTGYPTAGGTNRGSWQGLLLVAGEHRGLLVRSITTKDGPFPYTVLPLGQAFATERGRVLIRPEGYPSFVGHFTDDGGLALVADTTVAAGRLVDSLHATPSEGMDLNYPVGVYTLTWQTEYYVDGRRSTASSRTSWSGRGAIAVMGDTVTVDIVVSNSRGGSTGFFGRSPVRAGRFQMKQSDGSSLDGTITGGLLQATWIDRREGGSHFEGVLTGKRQ